MSATINIESDIQSAQLSLRELGDTISEKKFQRQFLSKVGTTAVSIAKKAYKPRGLNIGTGTLKKSIKKKVTRDGNAVYIEASARKKGVKYGYPLSIGAVINSKKVLRFQIDGKWVSTHSFTIPPRDYVNAPIAEWARSAKFQERVDQIIDSEILKWEKKNANN